ncbi:EF hand domain-containing protein [Hephaestia caeni]|uniref:EF hand domain-containing protein n=1 Tax=Hephaestia caeni TaxID=645617 RepID=A0A397NGQ7_9SPHN|nr:histidine kinase [Hephaestia caeni]RIA36680.1 EF hand domain-containing protein [Hephaestia caeni]
MWRILAGGGAVLLLGMAGVFLFGSRAAAPVLPPAPPPDAIAPPAPLPSKAPEANEKTREQKRFDRYDKDRDDIITRDELLAPRRKAYAKLDTDHDGRLSFEEWAIATSERFAHADADKSGKLTRAEFATTRRKTKPKPKCVCSEGGE